MKAKQLPGAPSEEDVQDVSNYIAALNHGLERMRGEFPLSLRLIREIHEILLSKGRGSTKMPGEFRRSQNWIGGPRPSKARFVPPPPERLEECLGAFENFFMQMMMVCRFSFVPRWPMCSLKPSIHFLMVMAASGVC